MNCLDRTGVAEAARGTAELDDCAMAGLLAGHNVLLVEDEALIAFLVEDMLHELGAEDVWHASTVAKALTLLERHEPYAAVLDVNLGRERVYPVAARLSARAIPFVFASGQGRAGLAAEWADQRILQKPFDTHALGKTLSGALGVPA